MLADRCEKHRSRRPVVADRGEIGGRHSLLARPFQTVQSVAIEHRAITGSQMAGCIGHCEIRSDAKQRSGGGKLFDLRARAPDQQRRMTGARECAASIRLEHQATGAHERASAKDRGELRIDELENLGGGVRTGRSVMKKQCGKGGIERGGGSVTGGISQPEEPALSGELPPAEDIAADLNERLVNGSHVPALDRGRLRWNDGALSDASGLEISFL